MTGEMSPDDVLPPLFQIGLWFSVFDTGLTLLPLTTKAVVQIGMVVMIFGLLWFWAVIRPVMSFGSTVDPFVLLGLGTGKVIALMPTITLYAVMVRESSEASSVSR